MIKSILEGILASILIVEDEEFFRLILKTALEREGHKVDLAPDGEAGKYILGVQKYDVVVSDIRMPKLDGLKLLEWIKENCPLTPVILMTGFSEILEAEEAHKKGASEFLLKPFKESDIFECINRVVKTETKEIAEPTPDQAPENYFRIGVEDFTAGNKIPFSIYVCLNGRKYVKIAHSSEEIDVDRIRSYRDRGADFLYLTSQDYQKYLAMTLQLTEALSRSSGISNEKKMNFLKHTGEVLLEKIHVEGLSTEDYGSTKAFLEANIKLMTKVDAVFNLLNALSNHSNFLYAHSIGVSFYSVLIAKRMGWHGTSTLMKLSVGGMFHDVGKKEIDKEILDAPRITHSAQQRKLLETHPTRGLEILSATEGVPSDVAQIAFQHHEDILGRGYPQGLSRRRIHPLARVVAVANAFCKYAIKNPDSEGMCGNDAVMQVRQFKGEGLDEEVVAALMKLFP